MFEFLVGLYDKWLGRWIPTRFALFGTIGGLGVVVHMAVLAVVLNLFGEALRVSHYPKETAFIVGQTTAALVAMTFNFVLNNELTYADKRLRGFVPLLTGNVDFPRVMNALRGVGYNGYLTAELASYPQYPEQMVLDTGAHLQLL